MHIRLAMVDDHPMIISGLEKMLYYHKNIEIIAAYNNGNALLEGLKKEQPDVLLLDIQLPDITGNELSRIISKQYPDMKIIAMTSLDNTFHVKDMLGHGCLGYLKKTTDQKTLIEAIEEVAKGHEFLEPIMKNELIKNLIKKKKDIEVIPTLTKREKEVLQLILAENNNKQIANKLFLSERTVENHRFNLQQKLNVKNTIGLMKIAMQLGLTDE